MLSHGYNRAKIRRGRITYPLFDVVEKLHNLIHGVGTENVLPYLGFTARFLVDESLRQRPELLNIPAVLLLLLKFVRTVEHEGGSGVAGGGESGSREAVTCTGDGEQFGVRVLVAGTLRVCDGHDAVDIAVDDEHGIVETCDALVDIHIDDRLVVGAANRCTQRGACPRDAFALAAALSRIIGDDERRVEQHHAGIVARHGRPLPWR